MCKTKLNFSPFARQCFVTAAVCCNATGQGCAMGYPGVLLPQLRVTGAVDANAQSWIASVMALSIVVGVATASSFMDRLGRKAAAYAVISTAMIGWILLALAPNIAIIIAGRIFQGISFGIIMPLRPVLIGEYTSPRYRYRGSFLTTISLSQGIGIIFVHSVGSQLQWQYTAIICCSFPLVSFVMTLYSPKSPSWLAVRGRYDECRDAFHWLRGEGENEELEKMIGARIIAQEEHEKAKKMSKFKNFTLIARKREVYKPVLIAIHVYLLGQFCGTLTLANYSPMIIGTLMGDGANTNFWMIELDVLRLVVNAMAVFVVAGVRRRTMMFATGALCIAAHAAIAGYTYGKLRGTLPYDSIWIPALLLNIQMAAVGFGMVPMSTVITGEIFPLEYRGVLGTVSSFVVAGSMFMTLKTFPGLYTSTGLHGTYAIYCGVLVYSLAVIWFMLPETKGKTLQQIEEHFRGTVVVVKDKGDQHETVPLKRDPLPNFNLEVGI